MGDLARPRHRPGFALLLVVLLLGASAALLLSAIESNLAEGNTVLLDDMRRRTIMATESEVWKTFSSQSIEALRAAPLGTVMVTRRVEGDITLISMTDKVDTTDVWIVATATIRAPTGVLARHRIGLSAIIPRDSADSALHPVSQRAWAELF